jgi:hypothetical protein
MALVSLTGLAVLTFWEDRQNGHQPFSPGPFEGSGWRMSGVGKQNLSGYINGREKKFYPFTGSCIAEHSFCEA